MRRGLVSSGAAPKISLLPPPGGFNTLLDLRQLSARPWYVLVDVISPVGSEGCCAHGDRGWRFTKIFCSATGLPDAYLHEVDQQQEALRNDPDPAVKRRALLRIQQALIAAQEIGDEKLQIVQQVQDLIENKSRQLDVDYRNLDFGKEQESSESVRESNMNSNSNNASHANNAERQPKRARRTRTETLIESSHAMDMMVGMTETRSSALSNTSNGNQKKTAAAATGKKKKRKSRQGNQQNQHREDTPPPPEDDLAIDPDEPTYCLCDQISYGEMILCDNDLCPIEWFHFSCVSLTTKPKGKWFCPKCRGDRPNVMKPKAQFLKELERYNKEKEEKS